MRVLANDLTSPLAKDSNWVVRASPKTSQKSRSSPCYSGFFVSRRPVLSSYVARFRGYDTGQHIRGQAAREMFNAMGSDRKNLCGIEIGGRVREREHLACRYTPSDGYQCDFGFDLATGKSIGGSIC